MKAKKIIVSVTNDLYTDQRVHKVCSFLHENGYDVLLVGRKLKNSQPITDRKYRFKRFKLVFTTGALFYANYNLRLFWFLLFTKFDVLLSNDLDSLLANYCAHKIKNKSRLVYDTHELFTEVPELTARPKVRKVWLKIEEWIFPKLQTVYTVNESIASIYSKKYNKNVRIVRNVSKLWKPETILSKKELNLPENKHIIILQGSGINVDRGAEEAVMAMKQVKNALFLIVGSGDVLPDLKIMVKEQNLEEKVRFVGRVPYDKMMNYTYHADLGLSLDKDSNSNYKYSLPNKIFDYIHTTTPVISSDLIELKRVIHKHNVGRIIPEHSADGVARTINSILSDPKLLEEFKENCKKAALVENWEEESKVLEEVYLDLHEFLG
ncbi:glycosyltransferase [Brumimicrobium oceani]|uniref:Glycosyltransferase n=1 Tax=Brumimicrobium oceani TaxID=2100725 RepID=A0A2U2XD83_9FLAO|nr:glycosyltransferase [Brumimicrobium oceani]PWH85671.1 glycosyltransferase [Brumimicrobium oceani]